MSAMSVAIRHHQSLSPEAGPTRRALTALATAMLLVALFMVSGPGLSGTDRLVARDAVRLLATQTALIMNGTFFPYTSPAWVEQAMGAFIAPTLGEGYTGVGVDTPEQFWPVTGLASMSFNKSIQAGYAIIDAQVHDTLAAEGFRTPQAVFGYSQSAIIASVEKRTLAAEYADRKEIPPVSFVMIGNPYRPNGGFLSRFHLAAAVLTPWTDMTSTPTDTHFVTVDIARQYDVWADFPTYPLNLLADINAAFGTWNHWYLPDSLPLGFYSDVIETVSLDPSSPDYVPGTTSQVYGDTTYYMIPSEHLPMYYPLRWIGLGPLVDVIEPLTKVFVDLGYDRTTPYGVPTRMRLIPDISNLANAGEFVTDVRHALEQGGQALGDLLRPDQTAVVTSSISAAAEAEIPTPAVPTTAPPRSVSASMVHDTGNRNEPPVPASVGVLADTLPEAPAGVPDPEPEHVEVAPTVQPAPEPRAVAPRHAPRGTRSSGSDHDPEERDIGALRRGR